MWMTPTAAEARLSRSSRRFWATSFWLGLGVLLVALCGAPGEAKAAASCNASVTNGTFANLDVLAGGSINTTATLNMSCTGLVTGIPVTLCPNIDAGTGGTDGSGGRYLAGSAGGTLAFQIYQDSGRTQSWGSTSLLAFGATPTLTATPGVAGTINITKTLYATVTAASTAKPGTYSSSFSNQNFFIGLNLLSCAGITVGTSVAPATFTFQTTVNANCMVNANTLDFGAVGLITSALTAQNQLSVTCTNSTPYSLSLGNGLTGTGPTARLMTRTGGGQVTYGIYKDGSYAQPWGDVSQGTAYAQSGTGTGGSQPYTAYGRAPAQTTPTPGSYADTVVATVTY